MHGKKIRSTSRKKASNISRYSGKCDFRDTLEIHEYTLEELQNNVKIYVGNSGEPLHIEKMEDTIPYYPCIIGSAWFDNTERKAVIHLSSKSHVDNEEREFLESELKNILKIYNRCKRKNIGFDIDDVVKKVTWNGWNEEAYRELANRIKEKGSKATIDGIHLRMHEHYRKLLVDEMLKYDLNPCDYGDYERFVSKEV